MATVYELQNRPSIDEYVRAISALDRKFLDVDRLLFQVHYLAEDRTATSGQLARLAGIDRGHEYVNLRYGGLGHQVCQYLGITPDLRPDDTAKWWSTWSRGWRSPEGFVWQMLPEVASALERLGWVGKSGARLPNEVLPDERFVEGSVCRVTVNSYERNEKARLLCIAVHGAKCYICRFDFGVIYGPEAEGYIHVHHLRPLSEIREEYVVDPVNDLRPVCPNCHAVLHMNNPCLDVEELKNQFDRRPLKSRLADST